MKLKQSEIAHLRRLLAWMEVEYCLNPASQKGILSGLNCAVSKGMTSQMRANAIFAEAATKSMQCPAYIRQAVRTLKTSIAVYEEGEGIIDHLAGRGK